jgi:hypothetical protein
MVKGIIDILINDSNVQSQVTLNKASSKYKVYPNVCAEPEKFPYIIVRQTGKVPIECKGMDPNAYDYRYNVLTFEKSYNQCEELDLFVVAALNKPSGGTFNGVSFQDIRHVNTVDEYSADYNLHVKISSFEATVNEDQST